MLSHDWARLGEILFGHLNKPLEEGNWSDAEDDSDLDAFFGDAAPSGSQLNARRRAAARKRKAAEAQLDAAGGTAGEQDGQQQPQPAYVAGEQRWRWRQPPAAGAAAVGANVVPAGRAD